METKTPKHSDAVERLFDAMCITRYEIARIFEIATPHGPRWVGHINAYSEEDEVIGTGKAQKTVEHEVLYKTYEVRAKTFHDCVLHTAATMKYLKPDPEPVRPAWEFDITGDEA